MGTIQATSVFLICLSRAFILGIFNLVTPEYGSVSVVCAFGLVEDTFKKHALASNKGTYIILCDRFG
ncbi:hypothetical protein Hanom_Chr12g01108711 [Helianthus anomalus]